jgi:hypothetical protein
MSAEFIPSTPLNSEDSSTPLFDKIPFGPAKRALIERSVGYDGALVRQVRGPEALADHKVALMLKVANHIGKDALSEVGLGDSQPKSAEEKLSIIVDELVESQTEKPVMELANQMLREKVKELESMVSPDIEFLYKELERLQTEVQSKDNQIAALTDSLDQEILKSADKDLLLDKMRNTPVTAAIDGAIQEPLAKSVLAAEAPHTLKDELIEVTGGIKKLGTKVVQAVGLYR